MAGNANTTCKICGRQLGRIESFLAYKQDGWRVCPACYQRLSVENGAQVGFKMPTLKSSVIKLVFGVLFIISLPAQSSVTSGIIALVIGLALVAWAVVPYWILRKTCDAAVATALKGVKEKEGARKRCSACGAVSTGQNCEYCGTPL